MQYQLFMSLLITLCLERNSGYSCHSNEAVASPMQGRNGPAKARIFGVRG